MQIICFKNRSVGRSIAFTLIFSNAPNANVILAKASSLQNGSAGGLNYGVYATNVPIYNAALQNMINQRRALGQNVFLADMFSAVDYNTMFLSDHVHPNTLGLQAIAREWLTRLQAIRPDESPQRILVVEDDRALLLNTASPFVSIHPSAISSPAPAPAIAPDSERGNRKVYRELKL